jgi:hypothetical protein
MWIYLQLLTGSLSVIPVVLSISDPHTQAAAEGISASIARQSSVMPLNAKGPPAAPTQVINRTPPPDWISLPSLCTLPGPCCPSRSLRSVCPPACSWLASICPKAAKETCCGGHLTCLCGTLYILTVMCLHPFPSPLSPLYQASKGGADAASADPPATSSAGPQSAAAAVNGSEGRGLKRSSGVGGQWGGPSTGIASKRHAAPGVNGSKDWPHGPGLQRSVNNARTFGHKLRGGTNVGVGSVKGMKGGGGGSKVGVGWWVGDTGSWVAPQHAGSVRAALAGVHALTSLHRLRVWFARISLHRLVQ